VNGCSDIAAARVLAVDDDPVIRDIYRRVLAAPEAPSPSAPELADLEAKLFGAQDEAECRPPSFDLTLCSQGDEAVTAVARSVVENRPYAVVFLDVRMPPGPDGVWTAEHIRGLDPRVEIVIVTGYSDVAPYEVSRRAPPARQLIYIQKPFTPQEVRQLAAALTDKWHTREVENRRMCEEMVLRLAAAAEARDHDTGEHLHRIALYTALLAEASGWGLRETDDVRIASMLHDVGKIGVVDEVLQKPGKLTEAEAQIMRTHTDVGARLLEGSDLPVLQLAQKIALCHHERWDGTGYPQGLSGTEIPESARLVAIADVYDALVHDRIYRPAFPEEVAVAMLKEGRASQFDPDLLDRFVELLPKVRALSREMGTGHASLSALLAAAV